MSNSTEAGIVMLLAFGWFIFISTLMMLVRLNGHGSWTDDVTSDGFNQILIFETLILAITFCFLWCRGWSWSDLNLGCSINHIRDAIILLVVTMIILSTVFAALKAAGIYAVGDGAGTSVKGDVNWYFLVPSILVNSFYEEFFLLCYLFKRLDRSTPVMIIGISTLIRVSYHTYQGPLGWISLLVMGIIMAWYYHKFKNLTAPMLMHTFWNLLIFAQSIFKQ